jgi:hypothetical protein
MEVSRAENLHKNSSLSDLFAVRLIVLIGSPLSNTRWSRGYWRGTDGILFAFKINLELP